MSERAVRGHGRTWVGAPSDRLDLLRLVLGSATVGDAEGDLGAAGFRFEEAFLAGARRATARHAGAFGRAASVEGARARHRAIEARLLALDPAIRAVPDDEVVEDEQDALGLRDGGFVRRTLRATGGAIPVSPRASLRERVVGWALAHPDAARAAGLTATP